MNTSTSLIFALLASLASGASGANTEDLNLPSSASCVDVVNKDTGISECPQKAYLCKDPIFVSLMKKTCPKTCGYCTPSPYPAPPPPPASCVDLLNPATGVSDCPQRISYCTNPIYLTLMKQQCPKTCGYCAPSPSPYPPPPPAPAGCVDLISDCPQRIPYCTNPVYVPLMKQQCPKTCGYCTPSPYPAPSPPQPPPPSPSAPCVDSINPRTGVSDCPQRTSYCTNPIYSRLMEQECPKTCGYCTPSPYPPLPPPPAGSASCFDRVSNCDEYAKNGFCSNFINYELRRVKCAHTCKLC